METKQFQRFTRQPSKRRAWLDLSSSKSRNILREFLESGTSDPIGIPSRSYRTDPVGFILGPVYTGYNRRICFKCTSRETESSGSSDPRPEGISEGSLGIRIIELKEGQCKWAIDDTPPYYFCGEPAQQDKPYCEKHYKKAHQTWVPKGPKHPYRFTRRQL